MSGTVVAETVAVEIGAITDAIARFRSGALSPERFRALRLAHGIYGQRQPGVHMVRIKVPAGTLDGRQLTAIADLAERHSSGVAHLTTRQDVQLHFVALDQVPVLLRGLAAAGLSTREACGNNVRNVTACPLSGDLADEVFPVRPFALATAAFFERNPFCQQMARKFKVAFSGCPEDCAATAIHDIGLLARSRIEDGRVRHGFAVLVGGGLGAAPFVAQPLDPFVPAGDLLAVLKSVLEVFADHGNRRVRTKARLKFVVHRVGIERFRVMVSERRAAMTREETAEADPRQWVPREDAEHLERILAGRDDAPPEPGAGTAVSAIAASLPAGAGPFARWSRASVRAHRDPRCAIVTIMVPLGDLTAPLLRAAAGIVTRFSGDRVRIAREQNLVLPSVPRADLPGLYAALEAAGLAEASAGTALDVTSCPGADTCALGITSSKGLARAIRGELGGLAENGAAGALAGVTIKISGCPNACGQHHVAGIGLHGVAKTVGGRQVPAYQVHLGGQVGAGSGRIGEALDKLPARRVPAAVGAILRLYASERRPDEAVAAFFDRQPPERMRAFLASHAVVDPADPLDVDWGATETFSTEDLGRGPGTGGGAGGGAAPFTQVRADLDQAGHFMEQGLAADALATISRARYSIARELLGVLGRRPDSDYETACEMRARIIDRGHADETWEELHRDLECALRTHAPSAAAVRALLARTATLVEGLLPVHARLTRAAAGNDPEADNPGA
jgi:sulfite reductase beta subunit-like hemoprotein